MKRTHHDLTHHATGHLQQLQQQQQSPPPIGITPRQTYPTFMSRTPTPSGPPVDVPHPGLVPRVPACSAWLFAVSSDTFFFGLLLACVALFQTTHTARSRFCMQLVTNREYKPGEPLVTYSGPHLRAPATVLKQLPAFHVSLMLARRSPCGSSTPPSPNNVTWGQPRNAHPTDLWST